jgi:arylsulfatase A-like enzyme
MDRVNPEEIQLRPNVSERALADSLRENPRFELPDSLMGIRTKHQPWVDDEENIRRAIAGYIAATMALDDYLGELVETIREAGILDNTIIVFTSDHGDGLGSHRFYGKDTPFEESISVPFLIHYPKKIPAGTTTDALFAPIDIMPTVLGLAGVECPPVDGMDLSGVVRGAEESERDGLLLMGMTHLCNASVISGMDTYRGIRTPRYTFARYEDRTPWLLYDNDVDPYQLHNLAGHPDYAELRERLNRRVDELLREAGDPETARAVYDMVIRADRDRSRAMAFREANPERM